LCYTALVRLTLLFLLFSSFAAAQTQERDIWARFHFFLGSWEGDGHGQPGNSRVERKYEFVLNDKFLLAKNKSVYPPQEKNPTGEVHEDWGLFSYDTDRKLHVFRQFHVEGFVNQYIMDTEESNRQTTQSNALTLVFVTEHMENIPSGWRARETYRILSKDEFIEIFELGTPEKDFEIYSETRFQRKKSVR